jgi:acyl-[acyl-carrier-protein]-phospholipid O-acyltransferase/long-chain-fatty-acid--[acyl-carrier-protein] ligase
MKIYGAAALIAARADADIVPLYIQGTLHSRWAATSRQWPRRSFPRVTLAVQPSTRLQPRAGAGGVRRRQISDDLLRILQQSMADAAPRRALFDALIDAADLHGRRTRIIEDLRRQVNTYGDLLKGSLALGRLTARFTEPGDRVGGVLPTLGATVCRVFGLASRGRVAAMLNYSSGVEALRVACTAATLRTVITSRAFIQAAHLDHLLAALEGCRVVYLEDLRETLTVADKLWIVRALLRPRSALGSQRRSTRHPYGWPYEHLPQRRSRHHLHRTPRHRPPHRASALARRGGAAVQCQEGAPPLRWARVAASCCCRPGRAPAQAWAPWRRRRARTLRAA